LPTADGVSRRSINRLSIASALHGAVQCYRLCRNSRPRAHDGLRTVRPGWHCSARPGSAWSSRRMLCLACCAALGRAVCTGGRGTAASCVAVARSAAAVDAAQQRWLTVKPVGERCCRSTVKDCRLTTRLDLGRPPRHFETEESPYRPFGLMLSAAGKERGSSAGRDVCDRSLLCNTASVCGMGATRNGPRGCLQWLRVNRIHPAKARPSSRANGFSRLKLRCTIGLCCGLAHLASLCFGATEVACSMQRPVAHPFHLL
jgi:hypothetical protein